MRSPLVWLGGKSLLVSKLLRFIPIHDRYIEVFGGGASLLFAKPRSSVEVYNDVDPALADFFRLIQDAQEFPVFYRHALLTLYSRQLYREYKQTWAGHDTRLERVIQWFAVARQSFAGRFGGSWGFSLYGDNQATKFMNTVRRLRHISARFKNVKVENEDWESIIARYDSPDSFFYLDPPYLLSTRRSGGYLFEMTDDDHKRMADKLSRVKGACMLSGYDNKIYKDLGWRKESYDRICNGVGRTRNSDLKGKNKLEESHTRTECVWLNYSSQLEMF